jgi:predicted RNA-binding Zn ribbon-like protein
MSSYQAHSRFEFTGGHLGLDFTNTVDNRAGPQRQELLNSYADLLQWAEQANVLSARETEPLRRLAEAAPGRARAVLEHAIRLREALYTLFSSIAERRGIPAAALTILNSAVQEAAAHSRIGHGRRSFRWEWVRPEHSLDSVLWPVARAAADLLTAQELSYVRRCAAQQCAWLFLDKTKNHGRRWCEMRTCGNRAKARSYYQRNKR